MPLDGHTAQRYYQAAADVPSRETGEVATLLAALGPNNELQDVFRSEGLRNAGLWARRLKLRELRRIMSK